MPIRSFLPSSALAAALLVGCAAATGSGTAGEDTGTPAEPDVPLLPEIPPDTGAGADTGRPDTDDGTGDVRDGGTIGDPCTLPVQCESDLCFTLGPGGSEGVCTDFCTDTSDCPPDFVCSTWRNTGSDFVTVCVPTTYCFDPDGDGFGDGPGCRGTDCDQADPAVFNGAPELCDGLDNNCNGQIDEQAQGTLEPCETGFLGICGAGRITCTEGSLACTPFETPRAETCNGLDDDCNGTVDDAAGDVVPRWYRDEDGDRFGDPDRFVDACQAPPGHVAEAGDCDDTSRTINPNAVEICDGIDNDCDGITDGEGTAGAITLWADADGDGFGDPSTPLAACGPTAGYVSNSLDCDDSRADIRPGATEVCDGVDNNCNGEVDENSAVDATLWYRDADGDTFGNPADNRRACTRPEGHVARPGDCNDADAAINPDAEEVCDGVDNNCSGTIDDGTGPDAGIWFLDRDNDTWGDTATGVFACSAVAGRVNRGGDCNDENPAVNPGATEVCNGVDDNCNGQTDEGVTTRYWRDQDGDGRGNPALFVDACSPPAGHVTNANDCNDSEPLAWTGRAEVCDGVDNNCNGQVDEGVTTRFWRDFDGDGFGNPALFLDACTLPAGYVGNQDDCDDQNNRRFPGNPEVCDGLDNNCNGQIDEGVLLTWYFDNDGDGFGNPQIAVQACTAPTRHVANGTDCNDNDNRIFPGNPEVCDGLDNNCNGQIDEGVTQTFWEDRDGDTWGGAPVQACTRPFGTVTRGGDCDDNNALANPGRQELCSTPFDDNCNGQVNESSAADAPWWYFDEDRDGQGAQTPVLLPPAAVRSCSRPADFRICVIFICSPAIRYVDNQLDCDDSTARACTGCGPEVCDGYDNDCNGTRDDGFERPLRFWRDRDGDTWGVTPPIDVCARPIDNPNGWATRCCDRDDDDRNVW